MDLRTGTVCNSDVSGSLPIEIHNFLQGRYENNLAQDIRDGLMASPKYIPCKYFYDENGSKLFEDICRLPEYYLTRTELAILKEIAPDLMREFTNKDLVELGSGASLKVKMLLDASDSFRRSTICYVPVDISESAIIEASKDLGKRYPELHIMGMLADFTCQMDMLQTERPAIFCFLGSTIGNMSVAESVSFLSEIAANMKCDDRLLIGFDMVKSRADLEAAYNDSRGITAEFNRNILNVVNNELGADFNPSHFNHLAFFNEDESRIEMYLIANRYTVVNCGLIDMEVEFKEGEAIHTENSRKFTIESIEDIACRTGLSIHDWYSDANGWFSLVLLSLRRPHY